MSNDIAILVIIIIIICVIIFLLCKCKKENFTEYNFYTNCDEYRLGDVFYGRLKHITEKVENKILNKYPDSICSKYIQERTKNMDIDTLLRIISSNKNEINKLHLGEYSNKNIAVVHLRLGDILDDSFYGNNKYKIDRKLYKNKPSDDEKYPKIIEMEYNNKIVSRVENPNYYLKSINYYINVINKLKDYNVDNVIIISGSHINCKNYKLSSYVLDIVKKLFEVNGINIKINIGKHPDSDLYLVINVSYFVPSNGGYSNLLTDVAKRNNVKII